MHRNLSLSIVGLDELILGLPENITHIISLVDPHTTLPNHLANIVESHHLVLYVHDALDTRHGRKPPSHSDIQSLCKFADTLDFSTPIHLLVHCHMGRSRSAAAAAILLLYLGLETTKTVFERIQMIRNPIWPNWTFIEYGDLALGYKGAFLDACENLYSRVSEEFPKWVEDPIPENIPEYTISIVQSSAIKSNNIHCNEGVALSESSLSYLENEVQRQLQDFARSTKIKLDYYKKTLFLDGSDFTHHQADPWLLDNLKKLDLNINKDNYAHYYSSHERYDLCMEDSWTGYFVAKHLAELKNEEPLIFIHLDDHTDMMSTLLVQREHGLIDPGDNKIFDPKESKDWIRSISSGAIGIGSFVTALYYLRQPVHVLHLNHAESNAGNNDFIRPQITRHPLVAHAGFATIEKVERAVSDQLGTYRSDTLISRLLERVPLGHVVVHIDLDYFINDFNGNIGDIPDKSEHELQEQAEYLITDFFRGIQSSKLKVKRWIIATSPGFCSARHWQFLLNQISQRII